MPQTKAAVDIVNVVASATVDIVNVVASATVDIVNVVASATVDQQLNLDDVQKKKFPDV